MGLSGLYELCYGEISSKSINKVSPVTILGGRTYLQVDVVTLTDPPDQLLLQHALYFIN